MKPSPHQEVCYNCRYFESISSGYNVLLTICRRFPPHPQPGVDSVSLWPAPQEDEYCGEFQKGARADS